jgi:hypothetical protein
MYEYGNNGSKDDGEWSELRWCKEGQLVKQ